MSRAREKASQMGILQGSITGGSRNVLGAIGEVVVADSIKAKEVNTYHYDLVKDGVRIDVKTKRCTSKPYPNYDCSVAFHGTKQDCDAYVFVRVLDDLSKAWILGGMSKEDFYDKATLYRKGDIDTDNGYTFKADCYNIRIDRLNPIHEIQQ
jgi:hypothetical protein|tara:strand:- start:113 stop:568 length:456 start_codon:yes stop_codon:yes gene_type:complete